MKLSRRTRDMTLLLPVAAVLLILPPYISIFDQPVLLAGIPLLLAYIFSVWLGCIILAAVLSRRILREEGRDDPTLPPNSSGEA